MARLVTEQDLARIRVRLLREASLFDDPQAYVAGVEDALQQVRAVTISEPEVRVHRTTARML